MLRRQGWEALRSVSPRRRRMCRFHVGPAATNVERLFDSEAAALATPADRVTFQPPRRDKRGGIYASLGRFVRQIEATASQHKSPPALFFCFVFYVVGFDCCGIFCTASAGYSQVVPLMSAHLSLFNVFIVFVYVLAANLKWPLV